MPHSHLSSERWAHWLGACEPNQLIESPQELAAKPEHSQIDNRQMNQLISQDMLALSGMLHSLSPNLNDITAELIELPASVSIFHATADTTLAHRQ